MRKQNVFCTWKRSKWWLRILFEFEIVEGEKLDILKYPRKYRQERKYYRWSIIQGQYTVESCQNAFRTGLQKACWLLCTMIKTARPNYVNLKSSGSRGNSPFIYAELQYFSQFRNPPGKYIYKIIYHMKINGVKRDCFLTGNRYLRVLYCFWGITTESRFHSTHLGNC